MNDVDLQNPGLFVNRELSFLEFNQRVLEQAKDKSLPVLERVKGRCPRLEVIWADGIYEKQWLIEWVRVECGWELQVTKRSDKAKGFQVVPKRWVVERTFAWLGRYRRLSKDYEILTETSEAMIRMAMIHVMVRRLEPTSQNYLASQKPVDPIPQVA